MKRKEKRDSTWQENSESHHASLLRQGREALRFHSEYQVSYIRGKNGKEIKAVRQKWKIWKTESEEYADNEDSENRNHNKCSEEKVKDKCNKMLLSWRKAYIWTDGLIRHTQWKQTIHSLEMVRESEQAVGGGRKAEPGVSNRTDLRSEDLDTRQEELSNWGDMMCVCMCVLLIEWDLKVDQLLKKNKISI